MKNKKTGIPTVNFHLTDACNFNCKFCFRQFTSSKGEIGYDDKIRVIDALAWGGTEKLNFVGGEPTLDRNLPKMITRAHEHGIVTSIVTNGTGLSDDFFAEVSGKLDWVGLSVDSLDAAKLKLMGRRAKNLVCDDEFYRNKVEKIHDAGINLKINTVVNSFNHSEDMTQFINYAKPARWKVMQMLAMDDKASVYAVTPQQFANFCGRHSVRVSSSTKMIAESNELMRGSYIMVDAKGRFHDDTFGYYRYSAPILDVGVERAFEQVYVDMDKMRKRGGIYDWKAKSA